MKITIHRGINQIDGCITEIESSNGTKILIDLGHNLPEGDQPSKDQLDTPSHLNEIIQGVSHIFYSHYHNDHIGFEAKVGDKVTQHIGALSLQMINNLREHMLYADSLHEDAEASLIALNKFQVYTSNRREQYNDIYITPLPISHSAIDAHMFLIECDGKVVLHTGDFRDHGYHGEELLQQVGQSLKQPIDVLITEGTMLQRDDNRVMKESELQDEAVELLKTSKYVFVLCSSMDADRLTSFILAAQRQNKNRRIVADSYQTKQVITIKNSALAPYNDIFVYNFRYNTESEIDRMKRHGFLMFVRHSDTFQKNIARVLSETGINPQQVLFIYSQFKGYIIEEHKAYKSQLHDFVYKYEWQVEYLHTSGHASKEALKTLCEFANPTTAIIPIHKEKVGTLQSLNLHVNCPIVESTTTTNDIEIIIK